MKKPPSSRKEARPEEAPDQKGRADASAGGSREALIAAATARFGEAGFAATSIRAIAADAGVNLSLISYYFGGKQGLYEACARDIVAKLSAIAGNAILPFGGKAGELPPPDASLAVLERALSAMVDFLVRQQASRPIARFIMRELGSPGLVLDILYDEIMQPVHTAACRLWAAATGGEPDSQTVKLTVFSLIGQIVYFRIARPVVMRRLGWQQMGEAEADAIKAAITANLRAAALAARQAKEVPAPATASTAARTTERKAP